MKTFITKIVKEDGSEWEGPEIHAQSWEDAKTKAQELGVILLGHLED